MVLGAPKPLLCCCQLVTSASLVIYDSFVLYSVVPNVPCVKAANKASAEVMKCVEKQKNTPQLRVWPLRPLFEPLVMDDPHIKLLL